MESYVRSKPFYSREWVFGKILHYLDDRKSGSWGHSQDGEGVAKENLDGGTTPGVLLVGGAGSGKTATCSELVWPSASACPQAEISSRILAFHFCHHHASDETLSAGNFVSSITQQCLKSPHFPAFEEILNAEPDLRAWLEPSYCTKFPIVAFEVLLKILVELPPPEESLLLLVDFEVPVCSEGELILSKPLPTRLAGSSYSKRSGQAFSILELLAIYAPRLPPWLLLLCTARRHWTNVNRLFEGFRKIVLDDLRRTAVVRDVQQYILRRLDNDEPLRKLLVLVQETAEMLNLLHIKSAGCLLYLERVLDGILGGYIKLSEIPDIPGTLNGLYLWLSQRLFNKRQFDVIRPILNVLLATKRPLTHVQLFQCFLISQSGTGLDESTIRTLYADFEGKHMKLLSKFTITLPPGLPKERNYGNSLSSASCRDVDSGSTLVLFHNSFSEWLLDVKHCTQRYLCDLQNGIQILALWHANCGGKLSHEQILDFAYYLSRFRVETPLKAEHLPLVLTTSGAPVQNLVLIDAPSDVKAARILLECGADFVTIFGTAEHRHKASSTSEKTSVKCGSDDFAPLKSPQHRPVSDKESLEYPVQVDPAESFASLVRAAQEGDVANGRILLNAGVDPNQADADGWSPLRGAAWAGHAPFVDLLLQHGGTHIDFCDSTGRTALRAASWAGHETIVSKLINFGADVNFADEENRTPLMASAYMGHLDIVQLLLNNGAQAEALDSENRSALSLAILGAKLCTRKGSSDSDREESNSSGLVDSEHLAIAELLLDSTSEEVRGSLVNQAETSGFTPLMWAAYEGNVALSELLLKHGAELELTCPTNGWSALFIATSHGHKDVIELLLEWGGTMDTIDSEGRTVLSVAAAQANPDVVRFLLEKGLDELHRDNQGWIPLHHAAFEGHSEIIKILCRHSSTSISEVDCSGRHSLLLAAGEGFLDCCQILVKFGAEVNKPSLDGLSPLRLACLEGHKEVAQFFISHGAEIDSLDLDGRSTLLTMVLEGNEPMVEFLLGQGANPDLRDPAGRTPLHFAAYLGKGKIIDTLLKWGAQINAVDNAKRSPLLTAAWQGHVSAIECLLRFGAAHGLKCSEGATPLHIAVQLGRDDIAKVLLDYGANPRARDNYDRTPEAIAEQCGHEVIKTLLKESQQRSVIGLTSTSGVSSNETSGLGMDLSLNRSYSSREKERHNLGLSPTQRLRRMQASGQSVHGEKVSVGNNKYNTHSSSISNYTVSTTGSHASSSQGDSDHYGCGDQWSSTPQRTFTQCLLERSVSRKGRRSGIYGMNANGAIELLNNNGVLTDAGMGTSFDEENCCSTNQNPLKIPLSPTSHTSDSPSSPTRRTRIVTNPRYRPVSSS